mmetsp:Transcript_11393/g.30691  ORF Transcript_11393/g.30691 Transcript_11393/m.30691 type:complete len:183 (-) Transcript_11393:928-1476(-)
MVVTGTPRRMQSEALRRVVKKARSEALSQRVKVQYSGIERWRAASEREEARRLVPKNQRETRTYSVFDSSRAAAAAPTASAMASTCASCNAWCSTPASSADGVVTITTFPDSTCFVFAGVSTTDCITAVVPRSVGAASLFAVTSHEARGGSRCMSEVIMRYGTCSSGALPRRTLIATCIPAS